MSDITNTKLSNNTFSNDDYSDEVMEEVSYIRSFIVKNPFKVAAVVLFGFCGGLITSYKCFSIMHHYYTTQNSQIQDEKYNYLPGETDEFNGDAL